MSITETEKKKMLKVGCLCRLKGSTKQGIYRGMEGTLALIQLANGTIVAPPKNVERVTDED